MDKYIIIVAGGKGLRMGHDLPKQFIEISGKPVLMRTVEAFYNADSAIKAILVLPAEHVSFWNDLCRKHKFFVPVKVVEGGDTRFHSVSNGLRYVPENSVVGIHDGVRPFVSAEVINESFKQAALKGGVVPVVDMIDSVREKTGVDSSQSVNRDIYKLVQTPQVFRANELKDAYSVDFDKSFTDDASVFERSGRDVFLVNGNRENIKITTPFDLIIAKALTEN